MFTVLLLEYDSPVDPRDWKNVTPLHLSAIHGHCRIAQLLVDHEACLAVENDEGFNALELAIHHGNKDVVEVILASSNWQKAMRATSVMKTSR